MERLDAGFQHLKLNEAPQKFGDGPFFFQSNQYLKGFNESQGRCGTAPRFGRFPTQPDMQLGPMNGYPYMNPWCMLNKPENVGIFGAPPNPQENNSNDHYNTANHNNFRRHYRNTNNNNSTNNNVGSCTWKSNFKTEEELFGAAKASINMQLYDSIPVKQSGPDWTAIDPLASFSDVELHQILMENIERAQYTHPTPVQKYALPIVLAKRDLMACAQTGSGKTAAFLLPILHTMLQPNVSDEVEDSTPTPSGMACPSCLILAPTRELSCQIYDEARRFSYHSDLKTCVVYGGAPVSNQMRDLSRGCDLLVATPGRLVDMISREKVTMKSIRFLVLDEADRMLDMGFEPQIRKIVEQTGMPKSDKRQTLMFSATFPTEIQTLAKDFLNSYIFLAVGRVGSTSENISQEVFYISDKDKPELLVRILREKEPQALALVFVETKKGADLLAQYLSRLQFPVSSIHGDRPQADRERALSSFRSGRTPVLIATAVAARGLDIPNVKHVINFDLPSDIEEYVHRIGRTGRMGQPGSATSFFCDRNQNVARHLVELLRESKQPVPEWLDQRASNGGNALTGSSGGRRFGNAQGRRSGGRPNYGSLDFRSGQKASTSYVPNPQNLGLLGSGAAPLAYMGPNLRYQQNNNPFAAAAAVAALGLQQPPFARSLFDARNSAAAAAAAANYAYGAPARLNHHPHHHPGSGNHPQAPQQIGLQGPPPPMSLLQPTGPPNGAQPPPPHPSLMHHGQAAANSQMHQFFAAAAAANMHAVVSTASSSPSLADFTSGTYHHHLQQTAGQPGAHFAPAAGYPTAAAFHPGSTGIHNSACSTPSAVAGQEVGGLIPNGPPHMYATAAGPALGNKTATGSGSGTATATPVRPAISPAHHQAAPPAALLPANLMPYYGHQTAPPPPHQAYGPPAGQVQQQQQQAALAAAMAMAAAMSNGSAGGHQGAMDNCSLGPPLENGSQSLSDPAAAVNDPKQVMLAAAAAAAANGQSRGAAEWWNSGAPRPAN